MDKQLVEKRFTRSLYDYDKAAFVQQQIARTMLSLVEEHCSDLYDLVGRRPMISEFGCGTGYYSRLLAERYIPERLWLNDLCSELIPFYHEWKEQKADFCAGDAEQIPFPSSQDLITGCSAIQWFEHPQAFFKKCAAALRCRGWLAFSSFEQRTFTEIRTLTGQGLNYPTIDEYKEMLRPWFDIVYAEKEVIESTFNTSMDVLRHLKSTGVTGTGSFKWTKHSLSDFCAAYTAKYRRGEGVRLTYEPVYIIAQLK